MLKKTLFTLFFGLGMFFAQAQCEMVADECASHFGDSYISDGQLYRALLYNDQVAEFESTLFGGNTYRISACSGEESGNLIFRIFDQEKNLLFTNADYSNAPYWDFVIESTMNCTIEAQLDNNHQQSGCAVLLIGFKE